MIKEDELEQWKLQRKRFSSLGFAMVFFMVITAVALILMMILLLIVVIVAEIPFDVADFSKGYGASLMGAASTYLIAFPASVAILRLTPKFGMPQRENWRIRKLAACLVIAVGIGFAGGWVGQILQQLKPWGMGADGLTDTMGQSGLWVNILIAVIMAPIVEELFFRKLMMDRLLGFGEIPAILFSGLAFGLFHGNFSQFFYAFGMGLLFAYVYARTGRVTYTIACHMIINLMGVVTVELMRGAGILSGGPGFLQDIRNLTGLNLRGPAPSLCAGLITGIDVVQAACLIGGIAILILQRPRLRFLPGSWPLQKGRAFRTMFLNGGMILYFCICALLFIIS